ncbi:hypothetical protein [Hymenobacter crusticola]|uniref:DUF1735 domain-containing protein n=1 Tax=Hymenobacter crusticola TaxID=1770526 RepID=A0A243WIZ0_9BACT|nr:hypothetical protein [Hymenobacter crusticola]OUJ75532.1 hypothetical protein BXP70_05860 [Hymenobacter crusticola]
MKKISIKLLAFIFCFVSLIACKKEYDNLGPLEDSLADIPVTVTNKEYFERYAIVTSKVTGTNTNNTTGTFSITFSIPADKGKIKEITKVGTGAGGLEYIQNSGYPNYLTAPVQGNGTNEITFTSDLNAIRRYNTQLSTYTATLPSSATKTAAYVTPPGLTVGADPQVPTQLRYFFLLTLEDGRTIIPAEVRVRLINP